MTKFVFSGQVGGRLKRAGAQQIGEALEAIRVETGGELHPVDVVEAARATSSPLHRHFQWDDRKAAHEYRLDQARALIRSVRIVEDDEQEEPRPAYLSVRLPTGIGYHALAEIMSSEALRQRVLVQAQRDLDAWSRRFQELREIVALVEPARRELRRRLTPRGGEEARP